MARAGKRILLEEGIYRDDLGLAGVVKVGRVQREKRFDLGTERKEIRTWRETMRAQLRLTAPAPLTPLGRDVVRYLRLVRGSVDKATLKSRRSELQAWLKALGKTSRASAVGSDDVRFAMAQWRDDGKAPKTILNRCRTLKHFWKIVYRQEAPFDGVTLPRPVRRRPIYVSSETIIAVERTLRAQEEASLLRDAKTRARFMVLTSTGIRPSHLKRATPADVDLRRRLMLLPGAKGGEPVAVPLNHDMENAWLTFIEADAWGHFDTRSFGRVLVHAGWPPGIRRYNARHAVGIDFSEAGFDLADIQQWMGHTDIRTTRAHYVPVVTSRLRKMSDHVDGRLGWTAPLSLGRSAGTTTSANKIKAS